jgi:toxin ParE1/3/4
MAEMKVFWLRAALQDLHSAHQYILEVNPAAANFTIEKIELAVQQLTSHPELGRPGRIEKTRELLVVGTPFLIPYRIQSSRIEILSVLHGKRRWPDSF